MKPSSRVFPLCSAAWFALLSVGNVGSAQDEFSVELRAEREVVEVADPFWVTVSATAPKGWEIELPDAPDAFGELKVIDTVAPFQETHSDTVAATTRFRLESLLPGRYRISPLGVRFTPANSAGESNLQQPAEAVQRSTEPLTIRVRSAFGFFESGRLRDINGTVRTPWTWRQWTIAAISLTALAVLGAVVYRFAGRWIQSRRLSQRSLLQQLDRLDESRLNRSITSDQFIVSVADVVRQSLLLAEGKRPVYRTTDEWIDHLQKQPPARKSPLTSGFNRLPDAVSFVLREADAIKFAAKAATLDQARRTLEAARQTVRTLLYKDIGHDDQGPGAEHGAGSS